MDTDETSDDLDLGERVESFTSGQKLLNRYKLDRILGQGGMGVVWLARDEELERDVAMKFLPAIIVNDRAGLNELKRETKRSLELTHPNIVRTYDFVQDSSIAGISMEYVECDTLRNRRIDQPSGVFESAVLGPWMRQLCSALDYAHTEAAIVHRDLKPANLMINARDQLKVADFGISRSLVDSVSQISLRRGISGTLVYMSPQQLDGGNPAPSDDIYALGATIYELMTSRTPFFSGDIGGQVRDKVPSSMRDRRETFGISAGEIPENWEAAVASCLDKNAVERPRSAGEVAVRLGLCAAADVTMRTQDDFVSPPRTSTSLNNTSPPPDPPTIATPVGSTPSKGKFAVFAVAALSLVAAAAWYFSIYLPANVRGSVVIKTQPPGATVKLGDALPQNAPAVFTDLKIGTYPVQIQRDGYEPKTVSVKIEGAKAVDLGTVALTRSKGSLRIATKPEGLEFELRSPSNPFQPVTGTTPLQPMELETGTYDLKVSRKGWPQQTRSIEVSRSETRDAFFDFSGGEVMITSVPDGALVMREKEELGKTPLPLRDLPPGSVKYTLTVPGYETAALQGEVQSGQTLNLNGELKKTPRRTEQRTARQTTTQRRQPNESDERTERIKRTFIPYYGIFGKPDR